MSLFVLSCKDGWVSIMYDGLDAVGVNQQVRTHTQRERLGVCSKKKKEYQEDKPHTQCLLCLTVFRFCFVPDSGTI